MQPITFEIIKITNIEVINPGHAGINYFIPYLFAGVISLILGNYLYNRNNTSNKSLSSDAAGGAG